VVAAARYGGPIHLPPSRVSARLAPPPLRLESRNKVRGACGPYGAGVSFVRCLI